MGKDTDLMIAVKNGDVPTVRKILVKFKSSPKGKKSVSKKLHINTPDQDGFTVLHHAALVNNVEVVLALLEMEADPNSRDKKGMCPLHMAAWAGKDQIVKTLLDNRALVNLPSFSGETPILLACQHGYADAVEVLLKYNADPSIRNNNLESPLDLACQFGHTAVIRLLLMRGEVVQMLRERQTDPRYKQPLHLAAKCGHADIARLLIESGADINEQSPQGTCLHLAALYGKVEVLKLLIEAGADVRAVNRKNLTPLDMVNQFTTSRAGIEIKQLLREAAGEHVIFAKALTDQINVYDTTSLSFKAGDTIMVLEQNVDGRWKGSICDGAGEKTGYFPATSVSIISKKRETQSLGSLSSSSDSSVNSAMSGKDQNQPIKSPRRMTESNKPVGVVPVGTYEVLTLAPTQSPDTKKPPNIPRLNSFKKDSKAATAQKQRFQAREEFARSGTSSNRSSSADTSNDSGIHSQSTSTIMETTYDTVPGTARTREDANVYDPIPQPTIKSPRIYPTQPPFEHPEQRDQDIQQNGHHPHSSYADIAFHGGDKPTLESPVRNVHPSYTEVYVADRQPMEALESGPQGQSEARDIPQTATATRQLDFAGSYERMDLNKELLAKVGKTQEQTAVRTHGYEDQQAESVSSTDEPFPSPPPLPLKTQTGAPPPSPPKKIESRFIHHRHDSYENVQPRQMVPVQVKNPFEAVSATGGPPQSKATSYNEYDYFAPPAATLPNSTYENYFFPSPSEPQKPRAASLAEKPSNQRPVPLPPKMNRKSCQVPVSPPSPAHFGSSLTNKCTETPACGLKTPSEPRLSDVISLKDGLVSPTINKKKLQMKLRNDPVKTPFLSQLNLEALSQDERDLLNWLIELKLPQYFQNFQVEGYDMVSFRGVTPEDLTEIEITKAGHRKKLLSEVTKLDSSNRLPAHKPDDVGAWLTLLGLNFYENNFVEGGFDEMDFIKDLDLSDLEMIEIRKKGHQRKILLAVQKLSDMELTAELDAVVSVKCFDTSSQSEAVNLPEKTTQQPHDNRTSAHAPQQSPMLSKQPVNQPQFKPSLNTSGELDFPAPPSQSELANAFLPNRDNLPPPSGKESITLNREPAAPIPPKAPSRVTSEKVSQPVNQEHQRSMIRTASLPVAPKPKPKPRPNMGQVRTASEYHATEPPPVIKPSTPQKSNLEKKGEESESSVTAARSRDFWLQNQQQQPATPNANVTPTRTKSISGIKPVPSQRPVPSVAPKPGAASAGTDSPVRSTNEPVARKPSLKKGPPPAPPRRDSMSGKKDDSSKNMAPIQNEPEIPERSRTFSGPLDEKIREVFHGKAAHHTPFEAPIMEPFPEESTASTKSKIDEDLAATDSIMADIDNMINDFTNQLDSMF